MLFAVLLIVGAVEQAPAKQTGPFERYAHRVFDQDIGLPETLINALARTPDGYLWLGTRRGLVRFDGLQFRLFNTDVVPALGGDLVNALRTDRSGRLWIGTSNGLAVLEERGFRRIGPAEGMAAEAVISLHEDRTGRIWVASAAGVFVSTGKRFKRVAPGEVDPKAFAEDRTGRIWVGTGSGLSEYRDGHLEKLAGGPAELVNAMIGDRDGGIWLGVRGGVRHLVVDPAGRPMVGPLIRAGNGTAPLVTALSIDGQGGLWIGSATDGVAIWDGSRVTRFGLEQGLSSNEIHTFLIDSRDRVWVGSGAALDLFQPTAFSSYSYGQGFPRSLIWAVEGMPNDTMIAAADNGGIYRFDGARATPVFGPIAPDAGPTPFAIARDKSLLVARLKRQVLEIGPRGTVDLTPRIGLPKAATILGIYQPADTSLWFATDSGVFRWDRERLESISAKLGLSSQRPIRVITQDSSGTMWLGRPDVYRIDGDRARHWGQQEGLTDRHVIAVYPRGENVWLGTADSGLFVLRHDKITSFGRVDRRLRSEVLSIIEDDFGYLWLASSYGLLRVSRADLEAVADGKDQKLGIRQFDRLDGLSTTEFNGHFRVSNFRDSQGRLWFPSYLGLIRVDPERVVADSAPPQVHLERLVVDGREQPVSGRHRFEPGVGRVEIEFAATDAMIPKRVRIQYQLQGVDKEWIEAGSRRMASFGPLEGGHYRFLIRAANEDGKWTTGTTSLDLDVALRLYEEPWFFPIAAAVVAALAGGVYWLRVRRIRERAEELERVVEERTKDLQAARDTLEHRVEERTSQLAEELAERKRLQYQLLQSQKLESIGRLAGGVAHEINNMMTGVLGFAEMAESQAKDHPALLEDLKQITVAGQRVAQITRQLLTFARRQVSKRSSVDVAELIKSLERFLVRVVGENVELGIEVGPDIPRINADASQVEQLVVNLVMNGRDAIPGRGRITVQVSGVTFNEVRQIGTFELLPGDYVVISVSDSGVGIAADVRSRLFEPFFTTKDVNRGAGLGLAVCYGIVTQHAGAIAVESEVGSGSRFEVYLPTGVVVEEVVVTSAEERIPKGSERILVVEDEASVRQVATRTLRNLGYDVIEAVDGSDALERCGDDIHQLALVLTDVVMPRLGGIELARALRERRANLPIVFMSGYAGKDSPWDAGMATLGPMLEKPFTRAALGSAVRGEIDRLKSPAARV